MTVINCAVDIAPDTSSPAEAAPGIARVDVTVKTRADRAARTDPVEVRTVHGHAFGVVDGDQTIVDTVAVAARPAGSDVPRGCHSLIE